MTPRLPDEPDDGEPPGTHTPEHPIEDPPPEGPPGAIRARGEGHGRRAAASSGEEPPPAFVPDVPRP